MIKTKHILMSILSVSIISSTIYYETKNIYEKTDTLPVSSIYQNNKETFIFEAPASLINEKSNFKKSYVLLNSYKVPVYKYPSSASKCTDYIIEVEEINILESTEDWYRILYDDTKSGYILKEQTTESKTEAEDAAKSFKQKACAPPSSPSVNVISNADKGQEVVNCAKKYLGVKYVYGGSSPSGFDCSGLVQYVCKNVGISVNRTAASQFNNGKAVNKNDLLPGDLLFFAKNGRIHHVGIYAGGGKMIHAPQTGDVVKLSDINTPYRQREFVGARRVF